MSESSTIRIRGAKSHNLKNIDVDIRHGALTVVTGVSGSGKSSLVFELLAREGQRRYLQSFSTYARLFLSRFRAQDVDEISGVGPVIALDQRSGSRAHSRSTVGTVSGLYDPLRLLFARVGMSEHALAEDAQRPSRSLFSFNRPQGMCPHCQGLGVQESIDAQKIVADSAKTLRQRALVITNASGYTMYSQVTIDVLNDVCNQHGFDVDTPWEQLTDAQREIVWMGSDRIKVPFGKHTLESRLKWTGMAAKPREMGFYKGILPVMQDILKRDRNPSILRFVSTSKCGGCDGSRLNELARSFKVGKHSIADLVHMSVSELGRWVRSFDLGSEFTGLQRVWTRDMMQRVVLLERLRLGYLSLERLASTLSAGERQRVGMAQALGGDLRDVVYVLDEPSVGLHPHDRRAVAETLQELVAKGNTVVVVEHDLAFVALADDLIELGPGAGSRGGELLFSGPVDSFLKTTYSSPTRDAIEREPRFAQQNRGGAMGIVTAISRNNLVDIDVPIQDGGLNVVCGVSGSGKSTLLGVLAERLDGAMVVDSSPIGKTSRSNPATYTKAFEHIRAVFAKTDEALRNGWDKSWFSFNTKGGRCETCEGSGVEKIGMHFLGEVAVACSTCEGRRFDDETLEIEYRGKNVAQVLGMPVEDAVSFFDDQPSISAVLVGLVDLGLGYLQLGQPSSTLSGGEAQRLKIAAELHTQKSARKRVYLLDEPTVGLHAVDVERLLVCLRKLCGAGHTVVTVVHDLSVIAAADYVVELGPGGGEAGGRIVAHGKACELGDTLTGNALSAWMSKVDDFDFSPERHELAASTRSTERTNDIRLAGVTTGNLKSVDCRFEREKITVVTGVSGSGKSSLVFDTLFSEGQRRFMSGYGAHARRMIAVQNEAIFGAIEGLGPTIAVGQHSAAASGRSTFGTMSEVFDYLRLLWSRCGTPTGRPASDFSFNRAEGACTTCNGLAEVPVLDAAKLIVYSDKSVLGGAMGKHVAAKRFGDPAGQYLQILAAAAKHLCLDIEVAWGDLEPEARSLVLDGSGEREFDICWRFEREGNTEEQRFRRTWRGLRALVMEEFERHVSNENKGLGKWEALMIPHACPDCNASRLNQRTNEVTLVGRTLAETCDDEVSELAEWIRSASVDSWGERALDVSCELRASILQRLDTLEALGLEYLPLSRASKALSGGELQRVRLARQLHSRMRGITYILDEPTSGLHVRDREGVWKILEQLKAAGNTIVMISHDLESMRRADHMIDVGPGAGERGGTVVASGTTQSIEACEESVTGEALRNGLPPVSDCDILSGEGSVFEHGRIEVRGARLRNLCGIDVEIPQAKFTVIAGVSGSGKSTLVFDVLSPSIMAGDYSEQFEGLYSVRRRGNRVAVTATPATLTGVSAVLAKTFAKLPIAVADKRKTSFFATGAKGGRCEACKGVGATKVSMDFLSDIWSVCDLCHGAKYSGDVVGYEIEGMTIIDVMSMNITSAYESLKNVDGLEPPLGLMTRLGLGHLQLGQRGDTLSAGEVARLKLVADLLLARAGKANGRKQTSLGRIYLFDEPMAALHPKDVDEMLSFFRSMVSDGHTVVAVEHDTRTIAQADWVIELGPKGGTGGGRLLAAGTPRSLLEGKTATGEALRRGLEPAVS